jgi:hypothetical protein
MCSLLLYTIYEPRIRGAIGAIGASKSLEAPVIEPRPINLNINTIKPHYTILTDMLPQTNCIEFKGSNIHFNL